MSQENWTFCLFLPHSLYLKFSVLRGTWDSEKHKNVVAIKDVQDIVDIFMKLFIFKNVYVDNRENILILRMSIKYLQYQKISIIFMNIKDIFRYFHKMSKNSRKFFFLCKNFNFFVHCIFQKMSIKHDSIFQPITVIPK